MHDQMIVVADGIALRRFKVPMARLQATQSCLEVTQTISRLRRRDHQRVDNGKSGHASQSKPLDLLD